MTANTNSRLRSAGLLVSSTAAASTHAVTIASGTVDLDINTRLSCEFDPNTAPFGVLENSRIIVARVAWDFAEVPSSIKCSCNYI